MTASPEQSWPGKRLRFLTHRGLSDEQRRVLASAKQAAFLPMEAIGNRGELDSSITRDVGALRNGYTLFFDGDVLVAKITPCFENGKGALVHGMPDGIGFGTTELHVLRPTREIDGRFLYYVSASDSFRRLGEAAMYGAAGQKRVPEDFVRDYRVSLPPITSQRAIADYLDRATGRLDRLVAEKKRVLNLLAEKRRVLITRAVTRGLDPNTSLRNSGILWIGKIPAHWEIWKISHFATVGNGSTPNRDNRSYWAEGTVPWLNSSVVNRDEVIDADQFVTPKAIRKCHLPLVRPNSVLIGITGQGRTRGQATVLTFEAAINQHMAFVSPQEDMSDTRFVRWALFSAHEYLRGMSDDAGGTKGALTCDDISNLRIALPALGEQRAIVAYVSAWTARLDAACSAVERTVALLKERRSALIFAAVTGRIGVESAP